MLTQKYAETVYQALEKVFRLVGFYGGHLRQMDKRLDFIENQLLLATNDLKGGAPALRFDIFMLSVHCEGDEVFKTKEGESSLNYILFKEGVKSLFLSASVTAREMADWCLKIRAVIFEEEEELLDLASSFWKNPSSRIRIQFYNNLSVMGGDFGESGFVAQPEREGRDDLLTRISVGADERSGGSEYSLGADAWDLPSAGSRNELGIHTHFFDVEVAAELKKELESSEISDRASHIVQFQEDELRAVIRELISYDESHVEYNLLCHYFSVLDQNQSLSSSVIEAITNEILRILDDIFRRFHGGLILFCLRKFETWDSRKDLEVLVKSGIEKVHQLLVEKQNLQRLAESFYDEKKIELAKNLIQYLKPEGFEFVFCQLAAQPDSQAFKIYVQALITTYPEFELAPQNWPADKLKHSVAEVMSATWDAKERFLVRCLRSKNRELLLSSVPFIYTINLEASLGTKLFQSLNKESLRLCLNSFLREAINPNWKKFMKSVLVSRFWLSSDIDLKMLWIQVLLKYLGAEAVSFFEPFVSERRFIFFPAHPDIRTGILFAVLRSEDSAVYQHARNWIAREKNLIFQPKDLRQLLRRWSR
ncbi:MAG: hypothetical protein ACO3LE_01235 [Bdellovibrionota bacterium]